MIEEEGRPYRQAEGAPQSTRTTYQATTPRRPARRLDAIDILMWAVVIALIAGAQLALCAVIWVVA